MPGTKMGGQKAAETNKKSYGENYYQMIGKKGGEAADHEKAVQTTKNKYGEDFYEKIGSKGGKNSHKHGSEPLERNHNKNT